MPTVEPTRRYPQWVLLGPGLAPVMIIIPLPGMNEYRLELGLNEVDGDFYSGVNVTDDAASKI